MQVDPKARMQQGLNFDSPKSIYRLVQLDKKLGFLIKVEACETIDPEAYN